jgi:type IV pilus assembly protein PilB
MKRRSEMTASTNMSWGTSLAASPNVENLKKQAKSILKAFRSGDSNVCDILKNLKKFQNSRPELILDEELCLRESQHALALNYGYKSWADLIKHADANSPVSIENLINAILSEAVKSNASDIHFEWNVGRLNVRLRVDGALRDAENQIPEELQYSVIAHIKSLAAMNLQMKNQPQNGMVRLKIAGSNIYMRVSAIPYVTGESIVIRIWNDSYFNLGFDKLGLTKENEATVRKWIKKPNGIIIFSGPTGSGKTTTLYGALAHIDTSKIKLVTTEDPVYKLIEGANQLQIDPANGLTYARAIQAQMNQDLDVMFVGECENKEVLGLICNASLTGHLIFTQMHSTSGGHAIRQLLDMGGSPYALAKSLVGISSQRLVRRICSDCKEEHKPEVWELKNLGIVENTIFYRGKGCDKCNNSGYRGRAAVYELLELNDDIRAAIANNASYDELTELAAKTGMKSLKQDAMGKVFQGITTLDEAIRVCE